MNHIEHFLGGVIDKVLGGVAGGGNTETRQALTSLSKVITDVSLKAVQQCSNAQTLTQAVRIVARGGSIVNVGDIDMSQIAELKAGCNINSAQKTDLLTKLQNDLQSIAKNQTGPLSKFLNGNFESNTDINVTNEVVNAVSQTDIAGCVNTQALKQSFDVEAQDGSVVIAGAIDMKQVATAVAECIMNSDQFVENVGELFVNMDNQVSGNQEGINPFDFLDNITTTMIYVVAVVFGLVMLLIIAGIIYYLMRKRR